MKQPLDYYNGPDIHDEDFIISNIIDLKAVKARSRAIDWPLVTALIAAGMIVLIVSGTLIWWSIK